MQHPLLLRPILEDWAVGDEVFAITNRLFPPYLYLDPGGESGQTLTLEIPIACQPGQVLTSGLRFPGFHENAIPIHLEIGSPDSITDRPLEIPISVTFPLPGESDRTRLASDPTTAGIFGLIGGLLDLDKLPAPWLAAELLTLLAQTGEKYATTPAGQGLRDRLQTTQLFHNGTIAFTQAQIPQWISQTLSAARATLCDRVGEGHLLDIWERWLFNLAHTDVESGANAQPIAVSALLNPNFSQEIGNDGGRWFAAILLGLAAISPRIASGIAQSPTKSPQIPALSADPPAQATYTLTTGIAGLEALPARWLAVELLLVLASLGCERSRSEAGQQLLAQLGRTRFFKNGVLAMASAQAPRWLSVSQSAAAAYHASVGGRPGQQGLLYFGEQWLWTVGNCDVAIAEFTGDATAEALGMDGDCWLGAILLGLAAVSPRVQAFLEAIAALPTPPSVTPAPAFTFDDILGEPKSLQR
jgi:hypothetical protein